MNQYSVGQAKRDFGKLMRHFHLRVEHEERTLGRDLSFDELRKLGRAYCWKELGRIQARTVKTNKA